MGIARRRSSCVSEFDSVASTKGVRMPTRRDFLQTGAAVAAAFTGAAAALGPKKILAGKTSTEVPAPKVADVQVPKMKFFDVEISRMVLGVNPFCGFAHYNNNYSGAMKEWYTPERVSAVM